MRNTAVEGQAECSTVVKIVYGSKKSKQCKVLATGILRYTGCIMQGRTVNLVFSGAQPVTLRSSVFLARFIIFFYPGATQPTVGVYFTALYWALASSHARLLDHTQRRVTVGRSPLNE